MGKKINYSFLFVICISSVFVWQEIQQKIEKVETKLKQNSQHEFSLSSRHEQSKLMVKTYYSNSINLINKTLQQYDKKLQLKNIRNSQPIQIINFQHHSFTTAEITFYRLKQTFIKYWLVDQKNNPSILIKIFDLRKFSDKKSLQQKLNLTIKSIKYLHQYETGPLFWIQEQTGKWRTLKKRQTQENNTEIITFILVNQKFNLKSSLKVLQKVSKLKVSKKDHRKLSRF